jgi:hypothetical protein
MDQSTADERGFYVFNFVLKRASYRPKADISGFYFFKLILMKNQPQIGQMPIEGDFMF